MPSFLPFTLNLYSFSFASLYLLFRGLLHLEILLIYTLLSRLSSPSTVCPAKCLPPPFFYPFTSQGLSYLQTLSICTCEIPAAGMYTLARYYTIVCDRIRILHCLLITSYFFLSSRCRLMHAILSYLTLSHHLFSRHLSFLPHFTPDRWPISPDSTLLKRMEIASSLWAWRRYRRSLWGLGNFSQVRNESTYLYIFVCGHVFVYVCVFVFVCLSVCLSVSMSVCLLSVYFISVSAIMFVEQVCWLEVQGLGK